MCSSKSHHSLYSVSVYKKRSIRNSCEIFDKFKKPPADFFRLRNKFFHDQ
jgi:hypothetical protein